MTTGDAAKPKWGLAVSGGFQEVGDFADIHPKGVQALHSNERELSVGPLCFRRVAAGTAKAQKRRKISRPVFAAG